MYNRFIGGPTIGAAAWRMMNTPYCPIFDYAKEAATTHEEAKKYASKIKADANSLSIQTNNHPAFALKLSSFNNDADLMTGVVHHMRKSGINRIFLDAEDDAIHKQENQVYSRIIDEFNINAIYVYKTYQMYRRDSMSLLLNDLSNHRRLGVKLVRGAYLQKDKNQVDPIFNEPILFQNKRDVDNQYNYAMTMLLQHFAQKNVVDVLIATHNNESISISQKLLDSSEDYVKDSVSFAQLLNMNDIASMALYKQGYKVYKYVPYGSILETMPYLVRRFYENVDIVQHMN